MMSKIGVGISYINLRFHTTGMGWNLWFTWKIPIVDEPDFIDKWCSVPLCPYWYSCIQHTEGHTHVSPRFHTPSVLWNLGLTQKITTSPHHMIMLSNCLNNFSPKVGQTMHVIFHLINVVVGIKCRTDWLTGSSFTSSPAYLLVSATHIWNSDVLDKKLTPHQGCIHNFGKSGQMYMLRHPIFRSNPASDAKLGLISINLHTLHKNTRFMGTSDKFIALGTFFNGTSRQKEIRQASKFNKWMTIC